MAHRDTIGYTELNRAYRNSLRWLGLSDSARNVLAFLLTEQQWTANSQSPEDICKATGLARSSVSAIMSKLTGLGLIESEIDLSEEVVGRRRTLHKVGRGLSGLAIFGLRRLVVQLQDLAGELKAAQRVIDKKEHAAQNILRISVDDAELILQIVSTCSDDVLMKSRTKASDLHSHE
jgi:DNA-binding transcriptional ArsR family regulator